MEPTFVFAAGANGVSAAPVELLLRGYRGVGVPQPGGQFRRSYQAPQDLTAFATEPSPLAGRTVADDVAATVEVIRRVAGHGPVVLVGASIGGALITLAAEQVPELVSTLVYDTAFCCVDLATPGDYLATPEAADSQGGALLGFAAADPAVVAPSAATGARRRSHCSPPPTRRWPRTRPRRSSTPCSTRCRRTTWPTAARPIPAARRSAGGGSRGCTFAISRTASSRRPCRTG
ncbi:alpha/beta hydrolase [Amycolatopsis sp. NBC_01480]|uniref:alpha/beta hydrolase n=1 Tax=Amycolatopsis sp. NBC_01480 TaxID=2903562 RepID=UPI002E29EF31|nr:alpha/beta fold hydrolase [Amycolatopsis sp. NBC_01480]